MPLVMKTARQRASRLDERAFARRSTLSALLPATWSFSSDFAARLRMRAPLPLDEFAKFFARLRPILSPAIFRDPPKKSRDRLVDLASLLPCRKFALQAANLRKILDGNRRVPAVQKLDRFTRRHNLRCSPAPGGKPRTDGDHRDGVSTSGSSREVLHARDFCSSSSTSRSAASQNS